MKRARKITAKGARRQKARSLVGFLEALLDADPHGIVRDAIGEEAAWKLVERWSGELWESKQRGKAFARDIVRAVCEPDGDFWKHRPFSELASGARTERAKWLARNLTEHADARFAKLDTKRVTALLDEYAPKRTRGKKTAIRIVVELAIDVGAFDVVVKQTDGDHASAVERYVHDFTESITSHAKTKH